MWDASKAEQWHHNNTYKEKYGQQKQQKKDNMHRHSIAIN